MKAVVFENYGDTDVIEVKDVDEPRAEDGQIRVATKAASINVYDWKVVTGLMAGGKPHAGVELLGHDAAGVVDEVGAGVTGVSVGDEVFGLGSGAQAEYAVLSSWAHKHPSTDWSVAAASGVAVETSERALRLLDLKAGSTLFIDGGAGGVGSVAVQMAVARGFTVIASGSNANQDYLREIRAIPVVYGDGMVERIRALAPDGVDGVFDVAGKTPIEDLISLVPEPSRVVSIANFDAAAAGAQVTGGGGDSKPFDALVEGAELLKESKLVIKVQTFPLARAREAYAQIKTGHTRGKVVLVID